MTLLAAIPLGWAQADDTYLDVAREVLEYAPVFDGHNDLPNIIREHFGGDVEHYDLSVQAPFETDIPRLRAGKVGAQFWSVYVPSTLPPLDAMRTQLEQIDIARRIITRYPEDLLFATSVADIEMSTEQGKIASLLGIEGGHTIVNSMGALRSYFDLGVRYMTLTHFQNNDWADSATDTPQHDGLSQFGYEVVREMNRLGMIVDLSHVSIATMNDVLDVTEAPVMFSHSSARALTNSPRNVPDEILKRMPDNDGIVMVTFIPRYITEERRLWQDGLTSTLGAAGENSDAVQVNSEYRRTHGEPPVATLSHVADHIEHVVNVAGINFVGLGSDFYGAPSDGLIKGLEDVSLFPDLVAELLRRGFSRDDVAKITYRNMLRVYSSVEETAGRLRESRQPSLMTITE